MNTSSTQLSGNCYSSIDIMKFICSLLVICIHISPFSQNSNKLLYFYFINVFARIAVPFFFAASGFFFFQKITFINGKIDISASNRRILWKYCKNIALVYFSWSFFYIIFQLPQWYQTGWWGSTLLKDIIISIFFHGIYYHLWFLLALLYAIPFLFFLLSYVSMKKLQIVLLFFWIIECLLYSYNWLGISNIPQLSWLVSRFPIIFDVMFRATPLLGVGILCIDRSTSTKNSLLFFILFFLACTVEASLLYFFSQNNGTYSYILFTPIMAFYLFQTVLCFNHSTNGSFSIICRKSSLVIYCLHPFILDFFKLIGITSQFILWMLVTVISVTIAFSWTILKQKLLLCRCNKKCK